ncbi:MAG: hypothetical protein IPG10_01005 [Flavobacteriales bacterium]|jgi:hypothetical protein|nr:hypothetical protein [Flavobacteriales bacterium]MBK6753227.1 hypothetical protein [Flavobacteriales bacterium]MBK7269742.1 hypothetical protein [Flavobacteriales bacterium]MBK7752585.1 hypothetical protein [Flavobacteriales bacterium]MBK9076744.1 hypothetical protein [Flavobacteriales bacterium]
MTTPSTSRPNPIPANERHKYPGELKSRIEAMISGQLDHPSIQKQLDTGASQVVLDVEAAKRVQWALMFSQLCMARMFIGFLGYKLDGTNVTSKNDRDWGYRQSSGDWTKKEAEDIRVEDVCGQAPPTTLSGHEAQIAECLLLAHKVVHLSHHEPHDQEGEVVQTGKVNAAIPLVIKLLQKWVYKPLGQRVPLPDEYREIMDKALPGWEA